jgi:hypothetical protein
VKPGHKVRRRSSCFTVAINAFVDLRPLVLYKPSSFCNIDFRQIQRTQQQIVGSNRHARGWLRAVSGSGHRRFTRGGDCGPAPPETGKEEFLERIHIVGLNDVNERVPSAGSVPLSRLDLLEVEIEQSVRPTLGQSSGEWTCVL